jgi:hypothetical protein
VKKREALSLAMNLSWTMLFSLLIPLLAGIWLDNKLGTVPLFILIGAILGISAATIGVARMTIRTFGKTTKAYDAVRDAPKPRPTGVGLTKSDQPGEANESVAGLSSQGPSVADGFWGNQGEAKEGLE